MNVLLACTYVYHVHAWCLLTSKEGILYPGARVQTVVSYHVAVENSTQVLCKSSQCS